MYILWGANIPHPSLSDYNSFAYSSCKLFVLRFIMVIALISTHLKMSWKIRILPTFSFKLKTRFGAKEGEYLRLNLSDFSSWNLHNIYEVFGLCFHSLLGYERGWTGGHILLWFLSYWQLFVKVSSTVFKLSICLLLVSFYVGVQCVYLWLIKQ